MKKFTVVSGKGGTGKTSLTASFAALACEDTVLVDGDVDAANLSLLTGSDMLERHDFSASKMANIDQEKCESCNLCRELCRFEAVSEDYTVEKIACEGCGLCYYACPHQAVSMNETISGQWFISKTPYGTLVHARLGVAEENSGKLVTIIRNKGEELAGAGGKEYLLIDGPPGIGCPVIASLSGVDRALVVTEPTVSGIHDLDRIVSVCCHFRIPAAVCINRYDISEEQTRAIENYCKKENIMVLGKIPFDRAFVDAMLNKMPLVKYDHGPLSSLVEEIWENFKYY